MRLNAHCYQLVIDFDIHIHLDSQNVSLNILDHFIGVWRNTHILDVSENWLLPTASSLDIHLVIQYSNRGLP